MSTLERSYIPQFIQFHAGSDKSSDFPQQSDKSQPEVIIHYDPSNSKPAQALVGETYQQNLPSAPLYPQLIPPGGSRNGDNDRTPLLPKKIAPTKTSWIGVFLAFISGVFFTLCSGTVKYLTGVDPMELLIIRSLFQVRG